MFLHGIRAGSDSVTFLCFTAAGGGICCRQHHVL